MKHGICTSSLIAIALIGLGSGGLASAAEQAAAMVTRIEPSTGGSARVTGPGRAEEVAFMMPLYAGDELQVDSSKMAVQVKFFGGDEVVVRKGEPLRIEAPPEERGMLSSVMLAISDKVFRNNQVSRRNLVTRSEGDERPLIVFGIGADLPPQKLRAGTRDVVYPLEPGSGPRRLPYRRPHAAGRVVAAGMTDGDFRLCRRAGSQGRRRLSPCRGESGRPHRRRQSCRGRRGAPVDARRARTRHDRPGYQSARVGSDR